MVKAVSRIDEVLGDLVGNTEEWVTGKVRRYLGNVETVVLIWKSNNYGS